MRKRFRKGDLVEVIFTSDFPSYQFEDDPVYVKYDRMFLLKSKSVFVVLEDSCDKLSFSLGVTRRVTKILIDEQIMNLCFSTINLNRCFRILHSSKD